jgi:hypothetical protein
MSRSEHERSFHALCSEPMHQSSVILRCCTTRTPDNQKKKGIAEVAMAPLLLIVMVSRNSAVEILRGTTGRGFVGRSQANS